MAKFDLRLRLKAENLRELTKQLKEAVEEAFSKADISESLIGRKKKVIDELYSSIINRRDIEDEKILGYTRLVGAGGVVAGRDGGGRGVGIFGMISKESPLLIGLFALLNIVTVIAGLLQRIVEMGSTFSGYGQALLKILKIMFELALKPIADIISYFMLPIMLALLKYVIIPWSKTTNHMDTIAKTVGNLYNLLSGTRSGTPLDKMTAGLPFPVPFIAGAARLLAEGIVKWFEGFKKAIKKPEKEKVVEESVLDLSVLRVAWGKFVSGLSYIWSGGKKKMGDIVKRLIRYWSDISDLIHGLFAGGGSPIQRILGGWDSIEGYILSLYSGGGSPVQRILSGWASIESYIKSLYSGGASPVMKVVSGWGEIKNKILGLLERNGVVPGIVSGFKNIYDRISGLNIKGGVIDSIVSTFESIADAIYKAYQSVKKTVSNWISEAESAVSSVGSSVSGGVEWVWDAATGFVSTVSSALTGGGYQIGGYVSKSGYYLLHGGEWVIPEHRIREVGGDVINITINATVRNDLDIRRIAEEVERVLSDKMMRRGALR